MTGSLFSDVPMVAALYVETGGAYWNLPGVDPWDEERDARLYDGPHPVVAHPPCNKWSPLAYINQKRIPGYRVGDDGGCFAAALASVRHFDGVLEHPALSVAWREFGLAKPPALGNGWAKADSGLAWVCEVTQAAYGHRARKLTWLYYCGAPPAPLLFDDPPVTATVSGFLHHPKGEYRKAEHRRVRPKEASRTPDAFRDALLSLARSVSVPSSEAAA